MITIKLVKERLPELLLIITIIGIYFVLARVLSATILGGVATVLFIGGTFWMMFLISEKKLNFNKFVERPVLFLEEILGPAVSIGVGVELLFL